MSIRIVQYQSPPGTASFGEPQFFGGDALQPVVAGDGGILKSTATRLVLDGGSFSGLKATLFGDFNYFGGAISGHVNRIKFFYDYGEGSVPFQDWRKVNWDVEEVTAVIDGFEDGDETAFDDFLAGFDYTFVIHKNHYGHVMTTDGDDTVVAQNVSGADAVHFIMTFGGDDTLNLKRMKADTYIETGTGKDVVRGGSGDDQIRSAAGRDVIKGGGGRDNIDGQAGRDKIYGQGGDDTYLSGGARNDKIWGGAGNDEIKGGLGADLLFGGVGSDSFIYSHVLEAGDRIADFTAGEDKLDLSALLRNNSVTNPVDLIQSEAGAEVWVSTDVDEKVKIVTLEGVDATSLSIGSDILS